MEKESVMVPAAITAEEEETQRIQLQRQSRLQRRRQQLRRLRRNVIKVHQNGTVAKLDPERSTYQVVRISNTHVQMGRMKSDTGEHV